MRLRLSSLALDDLTAIHDYTLDKWGEEQAVKYVHAVWDALEEIAAAPERWRLRPDIYRGCRARRSGRHLIIYRVREGTLEISRILHGTMNLREHLPRDFMGE